MNAFFREVAATNRAHCHAQGIATPAYDRQLSDDERNGRALSEPELERALVIDLDLARAVAEETIKFRPRKAKHLKHWPRTPIQQLGYIEEHIRTCGCTPREREEACIARPHGRAQIETHIST